MTVLDLTTIHILNQKMKRNNPPTVLQTVSLTPEVDEHLATSYNLLPLWKQQDPDSFINQYGPYCQAVVTAARFGLSSALLAKLPALEVVSSFGVGLDSLDLAVTQSRGIQVGYTPDVLTECVADFAISLLCASARRIPLADRFVRNGSWETASFQLASRIHGKRLGIVGLGKIGKAIARRAEGFSLDIRYHNPRPVPESTYMHVPCLKTLAEWCDFMVLSCPGGPATHHLVSSAIINALGPQGTLINVARGTVVDQDALIDALTFQRLGAAALDVFTEEPHVPAALLKFDNVVLTPHIGSGSRETREDMATCVAQNLAAYFEKGRVDFPAPRITAVR